MLIISKSTLQLYNFCKKLSIYYDFFFVSHYLLLFIKKL